MTIQKKQMFLNVKAPHILYTASELYKKCLSVDALFRKWDSGLTQCYYLAKYMFFKYSLFIFFFCFLPSTKKPP